MTFFKKNAATAAQAPSTLTPEETEKALLKAEKKKKIAAFFKKACIETLKGIGAGVVGIAVYRYMEQRGGSGDNNDVCTNCGNDAADLDAAYASSAELDYSSAMEVV